MCQDNNLSLNMSNTKKLIYINGAVERIESFKFITNKLSWSKHNKIVVKRARQHLFPLRRLKRCGMDPQILKRF